METKKSSRRMMALARLGLAAGAIYAAPTLMQLGPALASGAIATATDALTVQECGECHMPYSPRFLRAYAWQKVMANLGDHFGEDASLNEDTRHKIETYLVFNASRPRKIETRISNFKWFKREHNPKRFSAAVMARAKSFSNCTACHAVRSR